jgi:hypothetical protein
VQFPVSRLVWSSVELVALVALVEVTSVDMQTPYTRLAVCTFPIGRVIRDLVTVLTGRSFHFVSYWRHSWNVGTQGGETKEDTGEFSGRILLVGFQLALEIALKRSLVAVILISSRLNIFKSKYPEGSSGKPVASARDFQ